MHLAFDIFQGIGIAAAAGIRPFVPTLAVGALAAGDVGIHFKRTDFSFLQSAPFLLALLVCVIALALAERRVPRERLERGLPALVLAALAVALGAVLFAGSLARGHYVAWPGLIGGVICAVIALAATRPMLTRVRARLDAGAASELPLFVETAAVALAAVSVLAPPVGPIALAVLLWLLVAGRSRAGQKYAGLRILR